MGLFKIISKITEVIYRLDLLDFFFLPSILYCYTKTNIRKL